MTRFKLKETTVESRGEKFLVRELTHAERNQWVKDATGDQYRGPATLIAFGAVDPKLTEDEVNGFPGDVVTDLFQAIMKLSGMKTEKDDAKKA